MPTLSPNALLIRIELLYNLITLFGNFGEPLNDQNTGVEELQ